MGAGKNHAQAPHVVHERSEEATDAAIDPPGEGRKSATTTNLQVMPHLTSKSVGSRKAASSHKNTTRRSGASGQKKRRLGHRKVLGEGRSTI
jgi:hypothetical protein